MNRRDALNALLIVLTPSPVVAAKASVSTLFGTGVPGYSDRQVNNPYGLVIGPDRAMYFCDLDNQRIRRLDLKNRRTTTVAGNGQKGYAGDGGPATLASLNMPHEIQFDAAGNFYVAERDNHVGVHRDNARIHRVGSPVHGFSALEIAGARAPDVSTNCCGTGRKCLAPGGHHGVSYREPTMPAPR
jgi:hypothetical protein